jgi:hypothetical protein
MFLTRYNRKVKVKCFPLSVKLYEFLTSTLGATKVTFTLPAALTLVKYPWVSVDKGLGEHHIRSRHAALVGTRTQVAELVPYQQVLN